MVQEVFLVEKESIVNCKFNNQCEIVQQYDLQKKIEDATILGNAHHSKVSIIFQDDEGVKRVDTTIWAAGTKFICLKGGIWIPINRIIEILI